MKIPDVLLRKRREDVSVDEFFHALAASLDDPKGDPFSILIHLVQNGLKFAAGASGSVRENHQVDQGHVLDAINEARKAEVIRASNAKVEIKTPTDNEYEQLLYRLYVNRENTKQVYHALGYPSFPWPKEDIESVDIDLGWEINRLKEKLENVRSKPSKTSEGEKWKTERIKELKEEIAELWDFQLPESGYVNTTREPSEKACQHTRSENITSTPLRPLFPMPQGKSFKDLTIKVLSDEFLEFSAPGIELKRFKFPECGLWDWVKKEHNRVGKYLVRLAEHKSANKGANLGRKEKQNFEKLVSDTRKVLRTITGLKTDPFYPYKIWDGYKLRCTLVKHTPINEQLDEQPPPKSLLDQCNEDLLQKQGIDPETLKQTE